MTRRFIDRARVHRGVAGWALCLAAVPATQGAEPQPAGSQTAVWRHHHVTFSYTGLTTLYTCDGLESKVRAIFEFLGARHDMTVFASGCVGSPEQPTRLASVEADFYTPAPAPDGSPDAVAARWTPFQITSQHPYFMDSGDCELMQSMKATVEKDLTARGLTYVADCVPHEVHDGDFKVSGEALEVLPAAKK